MRLPLPPLCCTVQHPGCRPADGLRVPLAVEYCIAAKVAGATDHQPLQGKAVVMHTERFFFPTKGRLERRVIQRQGAGLLLTACVRSFWWGPLCAFLVFEQTQPAQPSQQTQPAQPSQATPAYMVTHDIVVHGQVAFRQGERVTVEAVSPDPNQPEYKYVVASTALNQKFMLSDSDISASAGAGT